MAKIFFYTFFILFPFFCRAQRTFSHVALFDTDRSIPSEKEQATLRSFLKITDSLVVTSINVLAYCDERGSSVHNDSLSLARASSVKNILLNAGFKESLFTKVEGKGEVVLHGNFTREKLSQNRKAVVEIIAEEKKTAPAVKKEEPPKKSLLSDNQKVGDRITLQNILFIGGRHVPLKESYATLDSLKQTLLEKKQYSIMILGHVCCQPPGNDGQDFDTGIFNLSVARAKAIYDYLVENGIDPARLDYKGLKSDFPTGKGDKYDRRVEIEITKTDGK